MISPVQRSFTHGKAELCGGCIFRKMFSINRSKEVSKKRFRPEDGMKESELSTDVEIHLADQEDFG